MSEPILPLEPTPPPLRAEDTGAVRVGASRVLLEIVVRAFQDGATPEAICERYPTVTLGDAYGVIAYYLGNRVAVERYLAERERLAEEVRQRLDATQPDMLALRRRLRGRRGA